jgi:hypothetical protein
VPVGLVGGTHVTNANTAGGDFRMILGLENRLDYIFVAKPTIILDSCRGATTLSC